MSIHFFFLFHLARGIFLLEGDNSMSYRMYFCTSIDSGYTAIASYVLYSILSDSYTGF